MVADCRLTKIDGVDWLVVVVAEARHVDEALARPRRPFRRNARRHGPGVAAGAARVRKATAAACGRRSQAPATLMPTIRYRVRPPSSPFPGR